ncbi:hypothetical protein TW79_09720 [Tritonibacter mobilis]|uniref:Uncharacterized protein n=1 Tax=Tritonibacter mobilis F1926 TaxID=1265309 RepID=A0A1B1A9N2_9RHOB|nr:hypothetical protein K529_020940 [Tritonibacter mobilis F1926]KJZ24350.1 hypothetical protein TW79_09720 [Tritonibacter mobilis]
MIRKKRLSLSLGEMTVRMPILETMGVAECFKLNEKRKATRTQHGELSIGQSADETNYLFGDLFVRCLYSIFISTGHVSCR